MEKLAIDRDTKELLEDVSSLFGVKSDIIKDVWEYTMIVWLLTVMMISKRKAFYCTGLIIRLFFGS